MSRLPALICALILVTFCMLSCKTNTRPITIDDYPGVQPPTPTPPIKDPHNPNKYITKNVILYINSQDIPNSTLLNSVKKEGYTYSVSPVTSASSCSQSDSTKASFYGSKADKVYLSPLTLDVSCNSGGYDLSFNILCSSGGNVKTCFTSKLSISLDELTNEEPKIEKQLVLEATSVNISITPILE